jgi:hypothetical protein
MRRLSLVSGLVALTALGCSDPSSVFPTTPSAPGVTGLELTGPSSIAPGQTVQLLANIRLADGTMKLPSPGTAIQWSSSNNSILRVTSTGLATGGPNVGEARIFVTVGTGQAARFSNKEFVVLPEGTFRMVGTIVEADYPSIPVLGARISVSPGGLSYITSFDGSYRLYGVPADAVVSITKAGYTSTAQAIRLTGHSTQNFSLAIIGSRVMISGPYRLTIDTTGSCIGGSPLSAALMRRTYDATVTQNGPDVTVLLTEARFRLNSQNRGNRVNGRAGSDGVTFFIDGFDPYYYYYGFSPYPSIAERLSDATILVPQGEVFATGSAGTFSGALNGSVSQWTSQFPFSGLQLAHCTSPAGQFTLTPR